jgi:hypothetical protein
MHTQVAPANLIGKETIRPNWLQRLGLFVIFLICEAAIFVFGSYYFDIFPTNKNLSYNLIVSAVFLADSLWFKFDKRLTKYWQLAFAFFMASVAVPFSALFDSLNRMVLSWFSVTIDSSQGLAIEKIYWERVVYIRPTSSSLPDLVVSNVYLGMQGVPTKLTIDIKVEKLSTVCDSVCAQTLSLIRIAGWRSRQ